MSYRYYIQGVSYEESEDPKALFFSESDWQEVTTRLLDSEPTLEPVLSGFTFQDGYATFIAETWTHTDPRIALACRLAQQLQARVFGEEDEEYPTQS